MNSKNNETGSRWSSPSGPRLSSCIQSALDTGCQPNFSSYPLLQWFISGGTHSPAVPKSQWNSVGSIFHRHTGHYDHTKMRSVDREKPDRYWNRRRGGLLIKTSQFPHMYEISYTTKSIFLKNNRTNTLNAKQRHFTKTWNTRHRDLLFFHTYLTWMWITLERLYKFIGFKS